MHVRSCPASFFSPSSICVTLVSSLFYLSALLCDTVCLLSVWYHRVWCLDVHAFVSVLMCIPLCLSSRTGVFLLAALCCCSLFHISSSSLFIFFSLSLCLRILGTVIDSLILCLFNMRPGLRSEAAGQDAAIIYSHILFSSLLTHVLSSLRSSLVVFPLSHVPLHHWSVRGVFQLWHADSHGIEV